MSLSITDYKTVLASQTKEAGWTAEISGKRISKAWCEKQMAKKCNCQVEKGSLHFGKPEHYKSGKEVTAAFPCWATAVETDEFEYDKDDLHGDIRVIMRLTSSGIEMETIFRVD